MYVILVQTVLLLFLQLGEKVMPSAFAARKACHAGSGALMLLLDPEEWIARWYVYGVVVTSLGMTWKLLPTWVPPFRFGADYDAGITIYLMIVAVWFYLQRPVHALAPLFFADPSGAVVGKFCTRRGFNMNWWQNKSVMGSLAVLVVAFASIDAPSRSARAGLAVLCMLAEAFGGKTFDNAVIAVVVVGAWVYYHG